MSYHFGNLQWAIAHVACLFGAYFSGVLIYSFSAENNHTSASRNVTWLVRFFFSLSNCNKSSTVSSVQVRSLTLDVRIWDEAVCLLLSTTVTLCPLIMSVQTWAALHSFQLVTVALATQQANKVEQTPVRLLLFWQHTNQTKLSKHKFGVALVPKALSRLPAP